MIDSLQPLGASVGYAVHLSYRPDGMAIDKKKTGVKAIFFLKLQSVPSAKLNSAIFVRDLRKVFAWVA